MKTLMTCALAMLVAGTLLAQEQEKGGGGPPEPRPSKPERVKALQEQLERVQRELAKEGVPVPSIYPGPLVGPGVGQPGQPAGPPELEKQIATKKAQIAKLVEEHGKDNEDVRRAQQEVAQLEFYRAHWAAGGAGGAPFVPDPVGGTGPDAYRQYLRMMPHPAQLGGEHAGFGAGVDPAEIGQRMVIAGLEVQLQALAERIKSTEDEADKEALTNELRETVEMVIEVRRKVRDRQIDRLHKSLAQLKKDAEHEESAEETVERLLKR